MWLCNRVEGFDHALLSFTPTFQLHTGEFGEGTEL